MRLKYLIEKEFKQIFRNKIIFGLIFFFPALTMLIFPWAINFEVKNIRVNVIDNSHTSYSQQLISKIDASDYLILNAVCGSYDEAYQDIETGDCHIIVEIPSSFDTDLTKHRTTNILVASNAVNGTQGMLGASYISTIATNLSEELNIWRPTTTLSAGNVPLIDIQNQYRFNVDLDYKQYMIPAFMVILLNLICGILPSMNIVMEKEQGTVQQINVSPIKKWEFILAKLIPFWVVGLIVITTAMLIVYLVYGFLPKGNIVLIYFSALVFIISISGMGILISNYSSNTQQASFLVMFFILILILLSGMFTPVSAMPSWAQVIAYINPLTYFAETMRMVYLKGSTLTGLLPNICTVLIIGFVLNVAAVLSYRKRGR